ncbi:MAG: PASTA domain-containing protein [Candidatus Acidiferrales bacterium]
MTLRQRLEWVLRLALALFVLTSVAFLSALTAMRFAIQGREVVMPDVVGQKADEAQHSLQERGVGFKVEDRIYSSQTRDSVVRQVPTSGMRVKIGQYAHVILSLGPQKVTIPQLEDRSIRAARIELLRGGMQLGEMSSAYLPGTEPDTVIQQDPAPGTSNVTSPHVNLLVALGPRPAAYVMPALGGLTLGEAESKMNSDGLKISRITPLGAANAAPGTVVGQSPSPGARVQAGAGIEVQVAE